MSWNDLSMKDKASYIRMGVENGITDLDAIREIYNKFAEGGNLNVNDSPEKRIYDHDKGVYYVEGQDTPNNLKYSLDEFTQEQINEINSKYNKGWKTDKKGNVIFNKYTGTPLNTNLRKSFANKEAYEHYTQEEPTPVGTKYKSNPSIVKAENMFKTVVRTMQRDSVDNSEDVVKRRNEEARKGYERTQQQNKEYNEEYKHRAGQFLDALALTSALGAMGTQIGASNVANKAMRVGMSTPEYNKLMGMSKNLDTANTIFEGIGMPIDIYQASEGFVNNDMKQALTNTYSALTPISKLIKVSNPKYYWLKPAVSFTGNLMEPLSKIFKEGGPIKKSLGGNLYGNGGSKPRYRSSSNIRKQISTWEGATMKTNTPFEKMDTMFNQVLPAGALDKLSQKQLDGLYSFAYNVGTGRFKTRTAPTLSKYLAGQATLQDVQNTMWAAKDSKLRGLANRRKKERSMLGAYVPAQKTIPMTTPLATPLDITPVAQPIIKSNPVIQDNIETLPLAFNIESQEESDYTPGFFDYVNYINQIRQPKQRDRRIWLTI